MNRKELIKKYTDFFSKKKKHKRIANSSLVPENDPTVLFTTAGMHPLVPFLLGQKHPLGKRLTNVQKCIRTGDIEEVGDTFHHTFFEMLGNWSLGDYFKKEAINWSFEFLTKELKLPIERLAVSCFKGNKDAPKDEEAAKIWQSLGVPKERIAFLGKKENWWGPAGVTGPCGPDTEMFYWKDNKNPAPKKFNPDDEKWVEIWNDVFMQYNKDEKGNYNPAKQKNVDTGMGVERTTAILNGIEDNYLGDTFKPIIQEIEKLSQKDYGKKDEDTRAMRIIADHIKAAVFILADGVTPSNTEQGYVLRRLIRRAIRFGKKLGIPKEKDLTTPLVKEILKIYEDYKELKKNKEKIISELNKEEGKFEQTLDKGLKELKKMIVNSKISGKDAFLLYQSYGFPLEMTKEIASENNSAVDEKGFNKEFKKHKELSRTASKGRFKSGLADNTEKTKKLHTATHLLLQALKIVLKDKKIEQKGSNITPKRLRLDFSFPRKLTNEEIKKVENLVNEQIKKGLKVTKEEMSPEEAKKKGACGTFDKKYGDIVSVYTIEDFSKEICKGPHVKNLSELGKFKIKKETSSSAGVRRIKAVLK
ncbi:alanine--tRNA ligase [Candidatus Pacearchaeota archaeon]|nr:alanine--tRNA ligase [Candidatus Pacearchaeota archaeon]